MNFKEHLTQIASGCYNNDYDNYIQPIAKTEDDSNYENAQKFGY